MKDYVMNEIEKLFNKSDYPFVTVTANGETTVN